jgi:hypothetical protein
MFMKNARLAETAFEQILQMHQKHSKQRYDSAISLLNRLNKRVSYKFALEAIIEQAIDTMDHEVKTENL